VDLHGWSIVDKNDASNARGGVLLPAGGAVPVVLSGHGAPLANNGGTMRLLNPAGVLMYAVSSSQADAVEHRFVRFDT